MVLVDNYSVHKSQTVQDALGQLEQADVFVIYLPSYCPQLSEIEPICNDVKHHHLPKRSHEQVADLKNSVDNGLSEKAEQLRQAQPDTTKLVQRAATYETRDGSSTHRANVNSIHKGRYVWQD